jgi:hypothetical protein
MQRGITAANGWGFVSVLWHVPLRGSGGTVKLHVRLWVAVKKGLVGWTLCTSMLALAMKRSFLTSLA